MSRNNFRRGASRIAKGGGKGGKGGGVTWDKWNPPSLDKLQGKLPAVPGSDPSEMLAVPVVLVSGSYKDEEGKDNSTYVYTHHKYQTKSKKGYTQYPDMPCIRGTAHAPQNCVGCLKVERKEWSDTSDTKEQVLVNMAHLVTYHHMPWIKQGQIQTKKGSNDPVMIWRECTNSTVERQMWASENGKTCEGCTSGAKSQLGGRRYLSIGWGNQQKLAEFQEEVLSRKCKNCRTGAAEISLKCGSCNTIQHALDSGGYTIDQIKALKEEKQICNNPQCVHGNPQNPEFLVSGYQCGYNDELTGWRADGVRCPQGTETVTYDIHDDVVLWLIRKGEGTESRIHVHSWCPVEEFPWPGSGAITNLTETGVVKAAIPTEFDFDAMFKWDTAKQAKVLNMEDPYGKVQNQGYSNMAPPPGAGYAPQQQQQPQLPGVPPQAAPQLPPQQAAYAAPQAPPPAPPGAGYAPQAAAPPQAAPQAAAPPHAAPYPQAPQAPGMPPAPGRPNWGGENQ